MKRYVALLVTLLMLISLVPGAYGAGDGPVSREYMVSQLVQTLGQNTFPKDKADLTIYKDAGQIEEIYQDDFALALGNGLLQGYEDNTLRPKDPMNRVEALVLLSHGLPDLKEIQEEIHFSDTPQWAEKDIARLTRAGFVKGYGDGTLGANDPLTASQVAFLLEQVKAQTPDISLQDDFYSAVNEELLLNQAIPPGESRWTQFTQVRDQVNQNIKGIIAEAVANKEQYPQHSIQQKVAAVYENAVNMEKRDADGLRPLQPYLEQIDKASTIEEYLDALANISNAGWFSLLSFSVAPDLMDSNRNVVYFYGCDTGLSREIFEGPDNGDVLQAYQAYLTQLFVLAGESQEKASTIAQEVYTMQRDLASVSLKIQDTYDVNNTYHVYDVSQLQKLFSHIDVKTYLQKIGLEQATSVVVVDIGQAEKINAYLQEEQLPLLKHYAKAILFQDMVDYLTTGHRKAKQDFDEIQSGITGTLSNEEKANRVTQEILGWPLGKLYVETYFAQSSKQDIENMVQEIIQIYEKRINTLTWMSESTKANAVKKLKTMQIKIGYPETWPTFLDQVDIVPKEKGGNIVANCLAVSTAMENYQKAQLGKPVDKTQWEMVPQTVNAYYNPLANEIVFPAGILQAPYYNPQASRESNLGGIGMVIGHEISHAFDTNGSQYDEQGNVRNWWTAADNEKFKQLAAKVADYYNSQEILPGVFVNGELTVTENIADLGGMACVLDIAGPDNPNLKDLFANYAHIWANISTEQDIKNRILTDVHSPGKIRTNGVLSCFEVFYDTYGIKETDGMYVPPEKRVQIW